ncbi:hypothetical protein MtrunA17_Chr8g0384641 [Medicago truncatula]|uniref:Uncharacterized protein n=1 Tax=Medicago truncatula TaxID=3880 RepID=A0A396GX00_MEDTR|nr:hypothetical protein MtrunA17_Chr8g0384641 [Medicago truncatula]
MCCSLHPSTLKASIIVGTYRSLVSPCPSCPFAPLPQEYTFARSVTATVCLHPLDI